MQHGDEPSRRFGLLRGCGLLGGLARLLEDRRVLPGFGCNPAQQLRIDDGSSCRPRPRAEVVASVRRSFGLLLLPDLVLVVLEDTDEALDAGQVEAIHLVNGHKELESLRDQLVDLANVRTIVDRVVPERVTIPVWSFATSVNTYGAERGPMRTQSVSLKSSLAILSTCQAKVI